MERHAFRSAGCELSPYALEGLDIPYRCRVCDPTPVRTQYRVPAVPDNDRFWLSAGVGYEFQDAWKFSLSYAHEFVKDADSALRPSTTAPEAIKGNLIGKYTGSVDIVAAQVVYRF